MSSGMVNQSKQKPHIVSELEAMGFSGYSLECATFLCEIGGMEKFKGIVAKRQTKLTPIIAYRYILYTQGVGKVSILELQKAYKEDRYEDLRILLEQLFLEPIGASLFSKVYDRLDNDVANIVKLYELHKKQPKLTVLAAVIRI